MEQIITPCGDNCSVCPRFTAKSSEALQEVARLWYKAGLRDTVEAPAEIKCSGCSSHKSCTYGLIECLREKSILKCNQCIDFPCGKIDAMLEKTKQHEKRFRELCSDDEFSILKAAFCEKEANLKK